VLRDLLPAIRVPVRVFAADGDPLVLWIHPNGSG
jgi:hypothetical protein